MVCQTSQTQSFSYLILALSIGITCNVFIVGINQIADVKIDLINKPYLPIPSGALNVLQAKGIVFSSLFISLSLALFVSPYLFAIVAMAAFIGWAYSMPPFYLKQHHISAALAITIVRGILLNAGGFLVFNFLVNKSLVMPQNVKILSLFIIAFSIVISWFKDLSDIKGDSKFNIKTFAIQYSSKQALVIGNLLVGQAYFFTIYLKWIEYSSAEFPSFQTRVLLFGHIFLLLFFCINAFSINLQQHQSIQKFYIRFWCFFFAEYLVYLIAYVG